MTTRWDPWRFFLNIEDNLGLDQEINGEPAGRAFPFSDLVAAKKQLEQSAQAEACWGHRGSSHSHSSAQWEYGGILAGNTEAQVFPWQPSGGGNGC